MKLIGSTASPYVRKVRIVMAEKKLDYEFVIEDVWSRRHHDRPVQSAGQGALPGHGRRRGAVRFARDRRIPRHPVAGRQADSGSGPRTRRGQDLGGAGRRRAGRRPSWCAWKPTGRGRAKAQRSQAWIDRQLRKIDASLKAMSQGPGRQAVLRGIYLSLADIAVGCALGYAGLPLPRDRLARRLPQPGQAVREAHAAPELRRNKALTSPAANEKPRMRGFLLGSGILS